jgi:hypothetical protein
MRKAIVAVVTAALMLAGVADAARFRVRFTVPRFDNAGSCTAPVLIPQPVGHTVRARLFWTGPVSGADSIAIVADGDSAVFVRDNVPEGLYTFRASICDAGGCSCDTAVAIVIRTPPATPAGLKATP